MSTAATGLFAAKWTRRIEEEWITALARHSGLEPERLHRRRDLLRLAMPDWEVSAAAWESLSTSLTLPDPDDIHVLAAAIAGHAECIVTANLKDFPAQALAPFGLQALHPDDFLVAQLNLDSVAVLSAFRAQRRRLRRPEMDAETFVQALERNGLVRLAQSLRDAAALL